MALIGKSHQFAIRFFFFNPFINHTSFEQIGYGNVAYDMLSVATKKRLVGEFKRINHLLILYLYKPSRSMRKEFYVK